MRWTALVVGSILRAFLQQGGISTPSGHPAIFLFTGGAGEAYGYSDGPADDGTFHFFGEGQRGDMQFTRGNRSIRDHAIDGKSLFLFQTRGKGKRVRYQGEYGLDDWEYRRAPDHEGVERQAIVFKLVPIDAGSADIADAPISAENSLQELREAAYAAVGIGPRGGNTANRPRTYYERSKAVRDYVLARANGICECCTTAAPFSRGNGSPYLEPHHIRRVSDGGPDHPAFVAAVCPNCHCEIHHGMKGANINVVLGRHVAEIEGVSN